MKIRGVNAATGKVDQRVTARMVWNNDAYKGAVCVNSECSAPLPGPNGYPTRFEAFENQYGRTSDPYDIQVQLYFRESTCVNRGGVSVVTVATTAPTKPPSTPTPIPVACQQIKVFKGTNDITANLSSIKAGDSLTFIAYAGSTAKKITFQVTSNNQKLTPIEVVTKPSTTVTGSAEASFTYTVSAGETVSVTVTNITY